MQGASEPDPYDVGRARQEAQTAKAAEQWEEGYQHAYSAREALLSALKEVQAFVEAESGQGVIGRAHIEVTISKIAQQAAEAVKAAGRSWEAFKESFEQAKASREALTSPPGPDPDGEAWVCLAGGQPPEEAEGQAPSSIESGQAD